MTIEKLYWKIEAESCISQIMFLIIICILVKNVWLWLFLSVFIIGNIFTLKKAVKNILKIKQ